MFNRAKDGQTIVARLTGERGNMCPLQRIRQLLEDMAHITM